MNKVKYLKRKVFNKTKNYKFTKDSKMRFLANVSNPSIHLDLSKQKKKYEKKSSAKNKLIITNHNYNKKKVKSLL